MGGRVADWGETLKKKMNLNGWQSGRQQRKDTDKIEIWMSGRVADCRGETLKKNEFEWVAEWHTEERHWKNGNFIGGRVADKGERNWKMEIWIGGRVADSRGETLKKSKFELVAEWQTAEEGRWKNWKLNWWQSGRQRRNTEKIGILIGGRAESREQRMKKKWNSLLVADGRRQRRKNLKFESLAEWQSRDCNYEF